MRGTVKQILQARYVYDGLGDELREHTAILVDGDRIGELGPPEQLRRKHPDATLVDLGDRTLLPGLVDAHVHLFLNGGTTLGDRAYRAQANAMRCLRAGLTTVRDLGTVDDTVFDLKAAIDRGDVPGPRIVPAGAAIAMTGGHAHGHVSTSADGVDGVTRAARQQLSKGAQVIKLIASGGAIGQHEHFTATQLTVEELQAGVAVAHRAGRRACVHTLNDQGAQNALAAGADSIEHTPLMSDETLERLVSSGTTLVPTLGVYRAISERGAENGVPDYGIKAATEVTQRMIEVFEKAVARGVRLVFGTDGGPAWLPVGDIGLDLRIWSEAGVPAAGILAAITRDAAALLQLQDEVGTLRTGHAADVVAVDGDVLHDILTLERPAFVMKGGVAVHRAEFG
ncbi:amidohydrolase family protein [Nocardioides sp.]|uniref:metal-dependent hydrolase family protein n=1 Tax=Nocardioides sp. TaxID=35761 RepID=UPI0039E23F41